MQSDQHKVRVEHLSKIFGDAPERALEMLEAGVSKEDVYSETASVVAVSDVSFTVGQGEIFVVMGLSGSGKSTLVRCVNRLIEPTAGEVTIDGEQVTGIDEERLRQIRLNKISMVFQHFALFPHRTVGDNVEFGLKVRGVDPGERRERALRALDMVGLKAWADAMPDNLSGGMQQRVGLARGLAVDPELLLMDEPFSALDPLIRREMQKELIELQKRLEMTIIFITHDLHEALILGTQIAIMKDGAFVQVGTPEEIVASPADSYVASFTQDVDRGRVITARTVARPAVSLRQGEGDVGEARRRLEEADADALFVVDDQDRPTALVTSRALARADGQSLDALADRTFEKTREGVVLAELFETCATGKPLAMVDAEDRLIGIVQPLDVFRELARGQEESERAAAEVVSEATTAAV